MPENRALASPSTPLVRDDVRVDPGGDSDGFDVLARGFAEACNRRDVAALIAMAHRRIVFRPSVLGGSRVAYVGHDGLRRWAAELTATGMAFKARICEVRWLSPDGFLVLSKVHFGEELVTDAAMIGAVRDDKVIKAHGYLSDEQMLARIGLIPEPSPVC